MVKLATSRSRRGVGILSPAPNGWRARFTAPTGVETHDAETLGEAAASIPASHSLHVELPCDCVLLERLNLPATDREELEAMGRLQLEKTLPFPPEEVTSAFEILRTSENETLLLAAAASNAQLDALCAPLREQGRLPVKIGVFARAVAAVCPADQVVPVLYKESGRCVLAICEQGKLGFAHALDGSDPASIERELRQTLLSAGMAGVPTDFRLVRLEAGCADLRETIEELFGVPVEVFALDPRMPESAWNLLPPAWQQERRRLRSRAQWKRRLMLAGAAWLALLLCALGWIGWLSHRASTLAEQAAAMQPGLNLSIAQQDRWQALAPAIEPKRFAVEVLFQVVEALPSDDARITLFTYKPLEFMIEGEAPSGAAAVQLADQLRKNPELSAYKVDSSPPQFLPNDRAQFRTFGKLP